MSRWRKRRMTKMRKKKKTPRCTSLRNIEGERRGDVDCGSLWIIMMHDPTNSNQDAIRRSLD